MIHRTRRLRDELARAPTILAAIHGAGYASASRAYAESAAGLGSTPGEVRRGGRGEAIRFAAAESSLGWVLVAASDRGVVAIELGDSASDLERQIGQRFAQAASLRADPELGRLVTAVVGALDETAPCPELALDIRGTAFQHQVWQALRSIPRGATASYAEIARAVGRPGALRAVGAACAANPLAVLVPCHRVVRGDGSLGGYRWGLDRKQALLDRERPDPP